MDLGTAFISAKQQMCAVPLRAFAATLAIALAAQISVVHAAKEYGPGVTDTEIKIGQTMPYSGPLSGMGTHGRAMAAYFEKLNQEGGVNGRKIKLISLDDGYSPPKTVEQTRNIGTPSCIRAILIASWQVSVSDCRTCARELRISMRKRLDAY
jgi:ABC-type branched-subunit amino acid transport system substrate-binding protein